ncbi:MAG: hypothetical protein J6Q67_07730 [Clostridia bacterium]|nr:hypothetical protein [Clostridia bacterium]
MSFGDLIRGNVGFGEIFEKIGNVFDSVKANGDIDYWWNRFTALLDKVPAVAVTGVLLALSLVMVFLGKRLLTFMQFAGCLALGFLVGVAFLAPPITSVLSAIPWWVVGLVVGVVCFLLAKLVYLALFIGVFGFGAYVFCVHGYILKGVLAGNWLIAAIVAAAVVVLVLICKKLVEMLGTATLGGFLASLCVLSILQSFNLIIDKPIAATLVKIIVTAIFAVFGFIVQYKTRVRDW